VYRAFFADAAKYGRPNPEKMPILQDLYDELKKQPEREAERVAAALELYVHGGLNVFNHRTKELCCKGCSWKRLKNRATTPFAA
jgi:hypothetical protein